jgi:MOSC domain-containing protein YiiM
VHERLAHPAFDELAAALKALPPAPTDEGRLVAIVCRDAPGVHRLLEKTELSLESGLSGDKWGKTASRKPDSQLTLMRADIARLVAAGQSPETSGDNLLVDLDLAAGNLPPGSILRIGDAAEIEVTPLAHTGCSTFAARFGGDALRFVQHATNRGLNLRGVHARVVRPGTIEQGMIVRLIRRAG